MCKMFHDKKAQVGETVTWIFATIVIISILGVSFFIAEFSFGENKEVGQATQADILFSKSFFSYLLTDDIYNQLKTDEDFNEVNGDLAKEIFEGLYEREYTKDIWMGILFNKGFSGEENEYFGKRPQTSFEGKTTTQIFSHISERVNLNNEKKLELIMLKHGTIN